MFNEFFFTPHDLDRNNFINLGFVSLNVKQKRFNNFSWIYVHTINDCFVFSLSLRINAHLKALGKLFHIFQNMHVSLFAMGCEDKIRLVAENLHGSSANIAKIWHLKSVIIFFACSDTEIDEFACVKL